MASLAKEIFLDEFTSFLIVKNDFGKHVYFVDSLIETRSLLASFIDGKWDFPTAYSEHEFFRLMKKYPSQISNHIHKPMDLIYEITLEKRFSCFKRKMNISMIRTLNKLKHLI